MRHLLNTKFNNSLDLFGPFSKNLDPVTNIVSAPNLAQRRILHQLTMQITLNNAFMHFLKWRACKSYEIPEIHEKTGIVPASLFIKDGGVKFIQYKLSLYQL
jgi:hypothetical protein